eukprot:TRINITY_DN57644_c0_g1_i1.p1 TRINITY_DN57644_c0_g1~~TRINITY_DN57644_c0_g1_i1.p1  ORF type:complete len:261 (-),score=45.86 TRINITY_DN57644_c0_g1_i1:64-765(-)
MVKGDAFRFTTRCRFFALGKCDRGEDCCFAHDDAQLREKPDLFKTRMCRSYARSGRCSNGDECRYAHSREEMRLVPKAPKLSKAGDLEPKSEKKSSRRAKQASMACAKPDGLARVRLTPGLVQGSVIVGHDLPEQEASPPRKGDSSLGSGNSSTDFSEQSEVETSDEETDSVFESWAAGNTELHETSDVIVHKGIGYAMSVRNTFLTFGPAGSAKSLLMSKSRSLPSLLEPKL